MGASALDERLVHRNRRPSDDSLLGRCHEDLARVAPAYALGDDLRPHVVAELQRQPGDLLGVFGPRGADVHACGPYGSSVSRCVAVRCTAAVVNGKGQRRPAIHAAA